MYLTNQPSFQGDFVDIQVINQSEFVIHVFQKAQHLRKWMSMYGCVYVCTCTRAYGDACIHMEIYVWVRMLACVYEYMLACGYAYV